MLCKIYSSRVDITALHASFINSKSKRASARASVRSIIGPRPLLSDELEKDIQAREIKEAFQRIFPDKKGMIEAKPKKRKKKKSPGAKK
jgi:hypothetical protein